MGMIGSERELVVTREKLAGLKAAYDAVAQKPTNNEYVKKLTMQSLKRLINQLTEEIVRYESQAASSVGSAE